MDARLVGGWINTFQEAGGGAVFRRDDWVWTVLSCFKVFI